MKDLWRRAQQFIEKDIWHIQLAKLPKKKAYIYRILRILLLTYRGFSKNQIQQGASSLTYYSLLAIVPIMALLIAIGRAFNFEKTLENFLIQHFEEQASIIKQIFQYANASLEEARGGIIAGVGILLLVWSAIKILSYIEHALNQIWEIHQGRALARQFTDYLALLFLAPIFLFLTTGLSGYISTFLSTLHKQGEIVAQIAHLLIYGLSILSFLLISLLFIFIYIFMPNTRVRFLPALIAGLLTGAIYQLLQWIYFYFQIGVVSYNAIYGTFAALPLFLIWLHLSWIVILLGAKLCYAIQHADAFEFLTDGEQISSKITKICLLRIVYCCIKRFINEQPPLSILEISNELQIPLLLSTQLAHQLVLSKILCETKRPDQEDAFQPACSIDKLTIKHVLERVEETGNTIPLPRSNETSIIINYLEKFDELIEKSEYNILLSNI